MSVAEIPTKLPAMNEANARDPYNNNSYGTLVDSPYKLCSLPILDVEDFNERVVRGYEEGYGEKDLPADLHIARSLVAAVEGVAPAAVGEKCVAVRAAGAGS